MGLTKTKNVSKNKHKRRSSARKTDSGEKQVEGASEREILSSVQDIAGPLCVEEGMELVHVEYQHESGGTVLRFFIDRPGGVSLDNCVNISRQLSDLLDINLELIEHYRLEVSSPGTDRPLTQKNDFQRFKGQTARIKVDRPVDGRRNFKGVLLGMQEEFVELMADDKKFAIPYQDITKARLVDYNGENRC